MGATPDLNNAVNVETLKFKFNPSGNAAKDLKVISDHLEDLETFVGADSINRKKVSKETYDYYHGFNQMDRLEEAMQREFPKTWQDHRRQTQNVSRRIVNAMSLVYKTPPDRSLEFAEEAAEDVGEETIAQADETKKEQQELFESILKDAKFDMQMQKAERYQNFDNTTLTQWMFVTSTQKMKKKVWPQFLFDIATDDDGELSMVSISNFFTETFVHEGSRTRMVWTKDNFWKLDSQFNAKVIEGNEENKNPYGILPFELERESDPDQGDYCFADNILSQTNLNFNLLVSDALYLAQFQIHGQWIGNNAKFLDGDKPGWGPETVVELESRDGENPAVFELISPNADVDGLISIINLLLSGFANSKGLPSNTFSVEKESASSGVQLKIRNAPMIEMRQSMQEKWRVVENESYSNLIVIWNAHADEHGRGLLSEDMKVAVNYNSADEAFESKIDQMQIIGMGLLQNTIALTEAVMKIHPGFTRDDAIKHIERIIEEKKRFGPMLTMSDISGGVPLEDGTGPAGVVEPEAAAAIFDRANRNVQIGTTPPTPEPDSES